MFKINVVKKIKALATRKDATPVAPATPEVVAAPKQRSTLRRLFNARKRSSSRAASLPTAAPTIIVDIPAVSPAPALTLTVSQHHATAAHPSSVTSSSPTRSTRAHSILRRRAAIPRVFKAPSISVTRATVDNLPTLRGEAEAGTYRQRAERAESQLARLKAELDSLKLQNIERYSLERELSRLKSARSAVVSERELLRREHAVLEKRSQILVHQMKLVLLEKASAENSRALLAQEKIIMQRARKAIVHEKASVEQGMTLIAREKVVIAKARKSLVHDKTCINEARALLSREKAIVNKAKKSLVADKAAAEQAKALLVRERLVVEKARKGLIQERKSLGVAHAGLVQSAEAVESLYEDCLAPFEESKEVFREVEWQVRNCKALTRCPIYGEEESEEIGFDVMANKREQFVENKRTRRMLASSDADHLTAMPLLRLQARRGKPQTIDNRNRAVSLRSISSGTSTLTDTDSMVSAATSTACGTPPASPTTVAFKILKQDYVWT
ncbi:hypothetical protein OE88DRAFT_484896 [Heliocybe sulcata]|uniref:Uncharacterized protein n=1 Tax=Heliocybe sulcata TaxID=5364 RepID=A0A5C3MWU0_9AGAM|nr:hypothetical protein OE88DRAFT_484896 [Heliocybe sulcata]